MFYADLKVAMIECLRTRVKNGQTTERGLARIAGVSQPHIHNVLKGARELSPELSDQILQSLRMSLLDLVDRKRLLQQVDPEALDSSDYSYLPVLAGEIGPGHPWPEGIERRERFRLPTGLIARMMHPVVVRLAEDARMQPLFAPGDLALLDQSHRARTEIDLNGYYVIKLGRVGLVRRLRYSGRSVFMLSNDALDRPASWERLPTSDHPLTYFIRARAKLIAPEFDWVYGGPPEVGGSN